MPEAFELDGHKFDLDDGICYSGPATSLHWFAKRLAEATRPLTVDGIEIEGGGCGGTIRTDDGWKKDAEARAKRNEEYILSRAREIEASRAV